MYKITTELFRCSYSRTQSPVELVPDSLPRPVTPSQMTFKPLFSREEGSTNNVLNARDPGRPRNEGWSLYVTQRVDCISLDTSTPLSTACIQLHCTAATSSTKSTLLSIYIVSTLTNATRERTLELP